MRKGTFLSTTVGRKMIIALTGLALFVYLILHLAGNLLVFAGPRTFNGYSHLLISNPLIVPIELALGVVFVIHVYFTAAMWLEARKARPVPYHNPQWAGKPSRKSASSSTMIYTGLFVLLFVIVHVRGFKYGAYYEEPGLPGVRDLHRMEIESFGDPLTVAFYAVSMVVVGFHLWHAFWSATQSLGVDRPDLSKRLETTSKVLALLIAGAFLFIPLFLFFNGSRP